MLMLKYLSFNNTAEYSEVMNALNKGEIYPLSHSDISEYLDNLFLDREIH